MLALGGEDLCQGAMGWAGGDHGVRTAYREEEPCREVCGPESRVHSGVLACSSLPLPTHPACPHALEGGEAQDTSVYLRCV